MYKYASDWKKRALSRESKRRIVKKESSRNLVLVLYSERRSFCTASASCDDASSLFFILSLIA